MEREEIEKILAKHKLWLLGDPEGERADLSGADLVGRLLTFADLSGADLSGADLRSTSLSLADLTDANLQDADLTSTILSGTYLGGADLRGANLHNAYLKDASLCGANLIGADLRDIKLKNANLTDAKIDYQIQEGLLLEIKEKILADHKALDMDIWHSDCDTTHCLAGWACHLNPVAEQLEETHGAEIAGLLTLGHEAHSYFYLNKDTVLRWIKGVK